MNTPAIHYIFRLFLATAILCFALPGRAQGNASPSVMKEGKWVKISIKEEGMQLLTPAALKQMGFSDPSKVHVYGFGGQPLGDLLSEQTSMDIPQQPVARLADGSIVFFGTGIVKWEKTNFGFHHRMNLYSTDSFYLLSDREATDLSPVPYEAGNVDSGKAVTTFTELMYHESELDTPANSGADLLGEDFRSTSKKVFSFPVTDPASDKMSYRVLFASKATAAASLTFSSDGKQLRTGTLSSLVGDTHYNIHGFIFEGAIPDKPAADLNINYSCSGVVTTARLDFIEASYSRHLRLSEGQLLFRHEGKSGEVLNVEGCSQNTIIWDVTDPASPRPVNYKLQGSKACFAPTGSGLRTYVAFNPAQVKRTPASVGSVANQDLHGMEVPDMVIISLKEYKEQAERIADYHRTADGFTVHVFTPEEVYNEFSSGAPAIGAFRRMLRAYYDRGMADGKSKLKHCLLFGRPSYDQRLLAERPRMNNYPRLITWQSSARLEEIGNNTVKSVAEAYGNYTTFCCDAYIGMLDNTGADFSISSGMVRIGVGRMPVKSVKEAKSAVDKLLAYYADPDYGAWRSHVMVLADDADNGRHLQQAQAMISNMESNGNGSDFVYERLYLDAYPLGSGGTSKTIPQARDRMFKMLEDGVTFLGYIGHANPTSWTHEGIMTYSDINSLTYKHLPIIYHASCEFIRFDDDSQSGAETMWLNPTSGAIAFIAANRKVFVEQNGQLSKAIGTYLFKRGADNGPLSLGEVFLNALNSTTSDGGNRLRYAIMGDPAMRIPSPSRSISVESLAGVEISSATTENMPVVPARSTLKVKGKILNPDGSPDASFNGTLTATLFDAERVITTYGHPSSSDKNDGKVEIYNDRKNRLAMASFPVKNGEWEATLYLPEEIDNNYSPAKLALYAYTPEGTEAVGANQDFYVYGYDDNLPEDTEAPEITMVALGSTMFKPGDIVGSSTTFLAHVRDDSGINISSSGIGKQMMIIIDGKKIYDDLSDYFVTDLEDPTGGSVNYPLDGLESGDHELTFQVFDNAGNCAKSVFPFKVGASGLTPEIDIRTDASPASTQATIYVTTASQPGEAIVEVFDLAGRRVWSAVPEQLNQSMSVTWDLCDTAGSRVPRGIYLYSATITGSDGTTHRRTRKLAVTAP